MWQDLCFTFRQIRLRPGFHALVILTFTVAVGLNTALFTLVNTLLLRSLRGYDTDRLVTIWQRHGPLDSDHSGTGAFDKFNLPVSVLVPQPECAD